jgi:hypothetical protein
MVVVFLAFLAAPDVFLKLFGIGLASAIFLYATVVRMVLGPAVMQLLGDRNWWIPDGSSAYCRGSTLSGWHSAQWRAGRRRQALRRPSRAGTFRRCGSRRRRL